MNKTVNENIKAEIKRKKKALAKDTPKKRAKYKEHQKELNRLYKLHRTKGRDFIEVAGAENG
jgi:predicted secreted Zn-dependent protease